MNLEHDFLLMEQLNPQYRLDDAQINTINY